MLGYVFNIKLKYIFILLTLSSVLYFLIQSHLLKLHNRQLPVLIWWTQFDFDEPRIINCWNKFDCLITNQNTYNNSKIAAYLFYGTNLNYNQLPLPRNNIPWAIFHEESPKNLPIFLYKETQILFNITSTFSRFSDMPILFQYLKELSLITSKDYYVPLAKKNDLLKEIAPILYIQSDCNTPIQRDLIVEELMKFVQIDSYGACLNNKEIPKQFKLNGTYELYDENFMKFVANYKFVLAIENSKCYDYITEKLWRPLIVGSIPIYLGAPSVKDWLPNNDSAILFDDYRSIQALAERIKIINADDTLYMNFLKHKSNIIDNRKLQEAFLKGYYGLDENEDDVIPAFECFVCKNVQTNEYKTKKRHLESVYDCQEPENYNGIENNWRSHWRFGERNSMNLRKRLN